MEDAAVSSSSIARLHAMCAVYTREPIAERMLDAIGWTPGADLSNSVLLEPCAGDGALLAVAAKRLLAAVGGWAADYAKLGGRIRAFEIEELAVRKARSRIVQILCEAGAPSIDAGSLANVWISHQDFLLAPPFEVTHAVANPPYVRWGKLPKELARRYVDQLGRARARGDLSIPFIHAIADRLAPGAIAAVLCTDRWLYSASGEQLRTRLSSEFQLTTGEPVDGRTAFQAAVLTYPVIFLLRRVNSLNSVPLELLGAEVDPSVRRVALELLRKLQSRFGVIEHAGCVIKAGPALGHQPAFVFEAGTKTPEGELLHPYVKSSDLRTGNMIWPGRRVARVNIGGGQWIDLDKYPRMKHHLLRHEGELRSRACAKRGGPWYRTIDPINLMWTSRQKVLIPEPARKPTAVVDERGMVPSHGIYALVPDEWPIHALAVILSNGVLELVARAVAPIIRGGSFRLYRQFLRQIPLPPWSSVDGITRANLLHPKIAGLAVAQLYGDLDCPNRSSSVSESDGAMAKPAFAPLAPSEL